MQQGYCAHHDVPAFFMKNYKGEILWNKSKTLMNVL